MHERQSIAATNSKTGRLKQIGLGLLLFGATVLAYQPCLHGGFVTDDTEHVTAPALRSLAGLWRIWSKIGATHQYYPILHTAFWLEYRLWGEAVLGYHLTNVLLHAGSACLLVAIVRRLALPGAWLAGFIYALHPVCVESVAWISEQKNTLSVFFGLASVLVYLRFDEKRNRGDYAGALGLFVLAMLSKSLVITLPAVLLVIIWWKRGRIEWNHDVRPLLPWFVMGVTAVLPVAWLERRSCAAHPGDFSLSWLERGLVAGRAFWFYLGKLMWPVNLTFIYPRWTVDPGAAWQYAFPLAVLVALAALAWAARRSPGPLAAVLIFAGTLFPVAGFFNVVWFVFSPVGDHQQYLACLGIIVLFAASAASLAEKLPGAARRAAPVFAVSLLAILGALTWRHSRIFRDAETLYRDALAHNPTSWIAHYNLGDALNGVPGRQQEVIDEWETTLRYRPDFAEGHGNLGCILANIPGRTPDAIEQFETALRYKPDYAEAHSNLAVVLGGIPGRTAEAIEHFEAALRYDPDCAETQNNFGDLLIDVPGRLPEAITHIETALRIRPDYAEAHWNLGVALSRVPERLPEAIEHVETALRLKPDLEGGRQLLEDLQQRQRKESPPKPVPLP
ncbi:MAG TPA: tetratricopeptide repeat protein [Verrucomicrobiae bacterium]|nr:tetratricopeptide repeat protein [Verrucomicrobiae bacterium]